MRSHGNIALLLVTILAGLILARAAGIFTILPSGRISGRVVTVGRIRKEDFLA